MNDQLKISSLLPYLETSGTRFHLDLISNLLPDDISGKSPFPISILDDSDPFTRLIEAKVKTDTGSTAKRVFITVQKDNYHIQKNEIKALYNQDIDVCWQNAFKRHLDSNKNHPVITLAGQVGADGRYLPFAPLFICKFRKLFFHPPCPKCGQALSQCYDDNLLESVGLQPYSSSLRRYLFCSSCLKSKGKTNYYTYEIIQNDPAFLKDRWDLIRLLGQGNIHEESKAKFPCLQCRERQDCYGSRGFSASRIAPFSFYSFYILVQEDKSVNACDFLALISGATYQEVKERLRKKNRTGRISCLDSLYPDESTASPFFFFDSDKFFLEVLFLKLSYLNEVARWFIASFDDYRYPDYGLSFENIWVKLTDQGGLPPFLWNFKVDFTGIGIHTSDIPTILKRPPSYGIYYLGIIWFYTLLKNRDQSFSHIQAILNEIMSQVGKDQDKIRKCQIKCEYEKNFSPDNIFWKPLKLTIHPEWKIFWDNALDMGWTLLETAFKSPFKWSEKEFIDNLGILCEKIKNSLFHGVRYAGQKEPKTPELNKKALSLILTGIKEKWEKNLFDGNVILENTATMSKKNMSDTFRTNTLQRDTDLLANTQKVSSNDFSDNLEVTQPGLTAPSLERSNAQTAGKQGVDLESMNATDLEHEETVIFKPQEAAHQNMGNIPEDTLNISPDKSDIPETMIIDPLKQTQDIKTNPVLSETLRPGNTDIERKGNAFTASPSFPPDSNDLEKTVILGHQKRSPEHVPKALKKKTHTNDNETIDETIILHPDKTKD